MALRPRVRGKSIAVGGASLHVRGVTYGTFGSDDQTSDFPAPETVTQDFAMMAAHGVNAVRTYIVPPRWLLDLAQQHGLRVMVGLPWEEHVTFLDDPERMRSIKERVQAGVRACAGHPAVLCYAVGNEIPASIVRWHGRRRIERFIHELYRAAKSADPGGLVTYVNYPSTEYLQLPFVDLVCFNVFLESGPQFEAYLARLQNIAGDRPLIVTETGLDSRRNTEEAQAEALDWQVRTSFSAGCAGVFVFSWTDEWHRGGFEVDDWDFGLVGRRRDPKRGLAAVGRAFAESPFPRDHAWPRISVVVCTYNGEKTLAECLDGLRRLDYPDYEVIVVNDGSTDASAGIAGRYEFRVISTDNQGLASARNAGLEAATGEIVAYIDDDASPDPYWLSHLAASFLTSSHVGVGGPNISPADDGTVADCVASSPGGPTHVLLSDREAEHIPGCNMAFRKAVLDEIGGFDPRFRVAGDDVDICWRLQDRGWTVGFSAGAVVWHHRRNRIRDYFKQQYEYGKAEALLERKWPARYNRVGHLAWTGRVYGNGAMKAAGWRRWKIYYGKWGSGLFQSVYQRGPGTLASLALVPEWYLLLLALGGASLLGLHWSPLLLAIPLLVLATGALVVQAVIGASRASFSCAPRSRLTDLRLRGLTALLYTLQPFARLAGRLRLGLAPWRRRSASHFAFPRPRTGSVWSERWQPQDERLRQIESSIEREGGTILHGGPYDRWDLEVRGGLLGFTRMRMAIEEHGAGRQFVRFRSWPRLSLFAPGLFLAFAALALGAGLEGAWIACAVFGVACAQLAFSSLKDCAAASGILRLALREQSEEPREPAAAGISRPTARPARVRTATQLGGSTSDNGYEPSSVSASPNGRQSTSSVASLSSEGDGETEVTR